MYTLPTIRFFFLDTGSCYEAQAGLNLTILLSSATVTGVQHLQLLLALCHITYSKVRVFRQQGLWRVIHLFPTMIQWDYDFRILLQICSE